MDCNICYFIPYEKNNDSIKVTNLVYEKNQPKECKMVIDSLIKMYYVTDGTGILHTSGKCTDLTKGDIFFTFPAERFCLQSKDHFTFMYISFISAKANKIMEQLNINKTHFHFPDCTELDSIWLSSLNIGDSLSAIISEGILLYSFAYIGRRTMKPGKIQSDENYLFHYIKKYVDDHISDRELSLEKIGHALSYSPKYISMKFKKYMKINLFDYITIVRIQNACTMMKQGVTSIKDISYACGFNDPQYFSKVFKKYMQQSPTDYSKSLK